MEALQWGSSKQARAGINMERNRRQSNPSNGGGTWAVWRCVSGWEVVKAFYWDLAGTRWRSPATKPLLEVHSKHHIEKEAWLY